MRNPNTEAQTLLNIAVNLLPRVMLS